MALGLESVRPMRFRRPQRFQRPLGFGQPGPMAAYSTGGGVTGGAPVMGGGPLSPVEQRARRVLPQTVGTDMFGEQFERRPGEHIDPLDPLTQRTLRAGSEAGFFNPFGSPELRNLIRSRILGAGSGRRRRAQLLAQLAGLDPEAQREALMDADLEASGQTAQQLTEAEMGLISSGQDWLRDMLEREREREAARRMQAGGFQQQGLQARWGKRGFGRSFGRIGGALIGGALGGPGGAMIGSRVTG